MADCGRRSMSVHEVGQVRFWGKADLPFLLCKCLLLTQADMRGLDPGQC
jgi:hypothetical protein